jgi:hypothetical protein
MRCLSRFIIIIYSLFFANGAALDLTGGLLPGHGPSAGSLLKCIHAVNWDEISIFFKI